MSTEYDVSCCYERVAVELLPLGKLTMMPEWTGPKCYAAMRSSL